MNKSINKENLLCAAQIERFIQHLIYEERSVLTIQKYQRDIQMFCKYCSDKELGRLVILEYKQYLTEKYKPTSVNSMLAATNSYFQFLGCAELTVKPLKIQRSVFSEPERELSKDEYKRLLNSAKRDKNERLYLLMQTICSTGIRVSELKFITVEAVRKGRAEVFSKGKRRTVFITAELKTMLMNYIEKRRLDSGSVFISRNGNPLNRHRIWADMKALCEDANVKAGKVFPHNLRHLFARTFYSIEKDLGRLADVLGHSNINTTRIYTIECGMEHEKILSRLSLVYK